MHAGRDVRGAAITGSGRGAVLQKLKHETILRSRESTSGCTHRRAGGRDLNRCLHTHDTTAKR